MPSQDELYRRAHIIRWRLEIIEATAREQANYPATLQELSTWKGELQDELGQLELQLAKTT